MCVFDVFSFVVKGEAEQNGSGYDTLWVRGNVPLKNIANL